MGKYFGTDGVRGVANAELTPELALRIGRAAAIALADRFEAERPIVVGRDTRLSGPMLEAALIAGITSAGRDTLAVGIVPTPGVATIARHIDAAAGIVISASHNPIEDNGIKIFGGDGYKLADAEEDRIEAILERDDGPRPTHGDVGIARSAPGLIDRYAVDLIDAGTSLAGLTIVVDAAFGAAHAIGPGILRRLGATVVALGDEPDGARINVECGATDLRATIAAVRQQVAADAGAHVVGVAFDGDADRALFVDESGSVANGDHVMLILARDYHARHALPGDAIVGTVMSNLGLEHALRSSGIELIRASVGDRYVLERMRSGGYLLGGEQSGHVVDLSRSTTGDGVMTAIAVFSTLARERTTLRELSADLRAYPQRLVKVRVTNKDGLCEDAAVVDAIAQAQAELGERGRILVRASGTEPLVRVMVEGEDEGQVVALADSLAAVVAGAARGKAPV